MSWSTRTIEESSSSVRLKIRQARLRVVGGPDAGAAVVLDRPCTTVGSDPSCELSLADETVSRRHLAVERSGLEHVLVDLGSRNGTFVGGARVERAVLGDGAEIVLGRTHLKLEAFEEEVGVAPLATDRLGQLLGTSPAMQQLYGLVERVAATDLPVLIAGETGTGKELVARELHARSPRAAGPFEVLDCGALPETLADSALFGHERGAFTGAHERFVGVFERAGSGTLLLDELGELPSALQPKLLGVLERGRFRRLAGDEEVAARARLVCATHRDLEEAVRGGSFRRDLLFRVDVLRIDVPPLRERGEDLLLLARHYCGDRPFTAAADDAIRRYGWPGNVRELRNAMRFASALAKGDAIGRADLPPTVLGEAPALAATFHDAKSDAIERFERRYLTELLAASGGNVTRAAQAADIDRRHLHRLLAKHGIST
ncbi:MAG: sigma 54-dependent Fis family transcriptional regulator [Deltaproteobacteria bacterium]|nr:sigma 54-dependent Fis family transcriptional regulator [Deltaproteobacteria bacterium]